MTQTFADVCEQRIALLTKIETLVGELDALQPQYDALFVENLIETGTDAYMTCAQIAIYANISPGRVANIWASTPKKLPFAKVEGQRASLRSDVDAMLDNRWKRT